MIFDDDLFELILNEHVPFNSHWIKSATKLPIRNVLRLVVVKIEILNCFHLLSILRE